MLPFSNLKSILYFKHLSNLPFACLKLLFILFDFFLFPFYQSSIILLSLFNIVLYSSFILLFTRKIEKLGVSKAK